VKKINPILDNTPNITMEMNLSEYIKCKEFVNYVIGFSAGEQGRNPYENNQYIVVK